MAAKGTVAARDLELVAGVVDRAGAGDLVQWTKKRLDAEVYSPDAAVVAARLATGATLLHLSINYRLDALTALLAATAPEAVVAARSAAHDGKNPLEFAVLGCAGLPRRASRCDS